MGDNLTQEQRSYCMSRVRNKNTNLEELVALQLKKHGLRFKRHSKELAGTPDIVFDRAKLAIFVDGDFWHGYRYPSWRRTLSHFWRKKIEKNRARDRRNFAKLRRMGWRVVRIWQHELEADAAARVRRIVDFAVGQKRSRMASLPIRK
jgi:DNA mismatch endonuclease, patch repair protein